VSIETSLERIATALEFIAGVRASEVKQEAPKPKQPPAKAKQKPVAEKPIIEEDFIAPHEEAPTYAQVQKHFFQALAAIRDNPKAGLPEAQKVARALLAQFTGGKPISEASLPAGNYQALYDAVTEARAKYE
jgi:hypothetical protein